MNREIRNKLMAYCLAAVIPLLLLAFLFNYSLLFSQQFLFGTNQEVLGYIIQAEFLAAASGILIILPLLFDLKSRVARYFRFLVFIILAVVFAWIAYDLDGLAGMLFYALLVFVTFGGGTLFVFDWYSGPTRSFLSLLRWSSSLFIYVSLQLTFDLSSDISDWKNTPAVIPFGASFFYILALLELFVYPPLTWYLEKRRAEEKLFSQKFGAVV